MTLNVLIQNGPLSPSGSALDGREMYRCQANHPHAPCGVRERTNDLVQKPKLVCHRYLLLPTATSFKRTRQKGLHKRLPSEVIISLDNF